MQEIQRYIEVGSGYIEIDRSYPEKYQGLCRRIYILGIVLNGFLI